MRAKRVGSLITCAVQLEWEGKGTKREGIPIDTLITYIVVAFNCELALVTLVRPANRASASDTQWLE